jgi:hypothetical protein
MKLMVGVSSSRRGRCSSHDEWREAASAGGEERRGEEREAAAN